MQGYSPLSENVRVASVDDEPLSVTEAAVARKLKAAVSISRAEGPDNLPNWVLKEYEDILAPPIGDILNTYFLECRVPRVWKRADVPRPLRSVTKAAFPDVHFVKDC